MRLIEQFIAAIKAREDDTINQARVLMLFYLLLAYCGFGLLLVFAYVYTGQIPQLIRASIITVFAVSLLSVLYFFNYWRIISHAILSLITILGVWANLLIYVQGMNAATLQYIWLASALGFYMHGSKWGWFYASLNIIPVLLDATISREGYFFLSDGPQVIARPIYVFVLVFDFVAIAFLHYFFFRAFNKNITTLTETKNQLNEINEKLSKTVLEINELSNARMNFLSTMSHELRTPLNGVIGLTNVLLLQEPRKDQEETLAVLKFSAENLLNLVNDVLDFNKLDSEMVELERIPFNLSDLVANIYAATRLKAEEKHLDFRLDVIPNLKDVTLLGDPTRLTQVLLNLLNNAIKFTEKGSVVLTCSSPALSKDSAVVRFVIEDTGIGIERSRQDKVFEVFVQASASTNRNYGGTGLGLPIVKKVLELYQSNLVMESGVNKGTKFSFDISFPLISDAKVELTRKQYQQVDDNNISSLKILVVEDNLVNVMVTKKILNRFGIMPDVAENGRVALDMVCRNGYDLILMDLYMPIMDGYEATKAIRGLKGNKKALVPIVALTATVNNQVLEDTAGVGMNGYLAKPFHPNDLLEELKKYI
ncbi:MAG: ATP-binding protein [Pedobacter sp.]|uniref:ATP-binding protein n=1 Tax=Pedobacter sp. TaxID=1411316 RepID=UPI002806BA0F|nr:ATP-binding protein [Pedobacter sp.]MDQ8006746.1 ATP-binding protein [Pedobacter sp.]